MRDNFFKKIIPPPKSAFYGGTVKWPGPLRIVCRRQPSNVKGFTLLEIMVALSIIAISLTTILYAHSLNIERISMAQDALIASILAQEKMSESEILGLANAGQGRGEFLEYPDFFWERNVSPTPFDEVKRLAVRVYKKGTGRTEDFEVEYYALAP